jgi:hypothetical protein
MTNWTTLWFVGAKCSRHKRDCGAISTTPSKTAYDVQVLVVRKHHLKLGNELLTSRGQKEWLSKTGKRIANGIGGSYGYVAI